MFEKPPRYRSYLLTVWEERSVDPDLPVTWRFSLEDARTGRRRGFAGLETLVAALQQEMAEARAQERDPATRPADQTSRAATATEQRPPGSEARGGEVQKEGRCCTNSVTEGSDLKGERK